MIKTILFVVYVIGIVIFFLAETIIDLKSKETKSSDIALSIVFYLGWPFLALSGLFIFVIKKIFKTTIDDSILIYSIICLFTFFTTLLLTIFQNITQ